MKREWNIKLLVMLGLCSGLSDIRGAKQETPSKKSALKRHNKEIALQFAKLEKKSSLDLLFIGADIQMLWDETYSLINKGLVSPRSHKKLEKMMDALKSAQASLVIVSRIRAKQRKEDRQKTKKYEAVVSKLNEMILHHMSVVKKIHATLLREPCQSLSCTINREALERFSEVVQAVLEEAHSIVQKAGIVVAYSPNLSMKNLPIGSNIKK